MPIGWPNASKASARTSGHNRATIVVSQPPRFSTSAASARLARSHAYGRSPRPWRASRACVTSPDAAATDPERQALLADSIGLAMLIVLDRLTPAERLAFVLHDTFGVPFDQIAPIVERSPTATRQLASRARRRVRGPGASDVNVPLARQRELVEAFVAAARAGDFEALLRLLDPDVVVRTDTAAARGPFAGNLETRGARDVATQALAFRNLAAGARSAVVNGNAGAIVFSGVRLFAVLAVAFLGDKIVELDFILRPDRLARLNLAANG